MEVSSPPMIMCFLAVGGNSKQGDASNQITAEKYTRPIQKVFISVCILIIHSILAFYSI